MCDIRCYGMLSIRHDAAYNPSEVLLGADHVQKKGKSKKSKAVQSTEDTNRPADDQENITNNASPPAEAAADPDNTVQSLSRCLLKHAHLSHSMAMIKAQVAA